MLDGTPPYNDAKLRATGQAFRTNINFGEGEALLEEATTAYVDLVNSVEVLANIQTKFGEPSEREEYSRIISEEFTRQLWLWPQFFTQFLKLTSANFIAHGVGIAYFPDEWTWQWKASGMRDFLLPRDTEATEEEIDVCCVKRKMTLPQLYRYIENPEQAEKRGWDVSLVRKVIMQAYSDRGNEFEDWESLQQEIKNNDIYCGAKASKVSLIHVWVQEFSGEISHFIIDENEEYGEMGTENSPGGFLYKKVGKYKNFNQAFSVFTYGIGTNSTYHGIRGLGYKVYPHVQVSNRIRGQRIDNSILAGAPLIQPKDERSLDNLAFSYFGPFGVLPPNVEYIDRASPDVSKNMDPVLQDLGAQVNRRAGNYTTKAAFGGDQRKTRFEVAAELEDASKLTDTALHLFYVPWDRLLREMVRRFFTHRDSFVKGGDQIKDLFIRCEERGVPREALLNIDFAKTHAVRAVGNGSAGKRMVQLQQLNQLAGTYDEVGRHKLFRDQTTAIVGVEAADRYIPSRPDGRFGVHAKVAMLENKQLMEGEDIEVLADEAHVTHLDFHLPKLEELFNMVEEGQLELVEAIHPAFPLFQHSLAHLENIQQDFSIKEAVANYNERLQQISELIINGQKALAKLEREQAQQAEAEGQAQEEEQQPQMDPKVMAMMQEHQAKLKMMGEKHQMEMMINLQKHQQKMQIEDAERAIKLKDLL